MEGSAARREGGRDLRRDGSIMTETVALINGDVLLVWLQVVRGVMEKDGKEKCC